MPPKTRRSRVSKASKENISVSCKSKTKAPSKVVKLPRKALADKTNSASDDNASFLPSKPSVNIVGHEEDKLLIKQRPRRDRRLPNRYVESNGIQNLSKSNNSASVENNNISVPVSIRNVSVILTPLKIPKTVLDTSLTNTRPKRICRLPSKFNDHSISPSKYVPVQPVYASTPKIANKLSKEIDRKHTNKTVKPKKTTSSKVISTKSNKKAVSKRNNDTSKTKSPNSSADTNNNAKTEQIPQSKTKKKQSTPPKLSVSNAKTIETKKFVDKNFSIRIFEDKKKSLKRDASNLDVYEFTYDPNEEPPPQKKKRKRPTKKREPKPKAVFFKDNYDKNMAKALRTLKSTISGKSVKPIVKTDNVKTLATQSSAVDPAIDTVVTSVNAQPVPSNPDYDKSHASVKNYNSVRVEDIALDFEQDCCADDVNYSPVHSVCQPTPPRRSDTPSEEIHESNGLSYTATHQNNILNPERPVLTNDPLNLREDLSFFDDQPVASSSMNVSTRNPAASPWRVEFGRLPIKWQVNTYVKPNMTPALESSFMNFNDSKKKHVYTNMVPDTNEENDLPQIYEDYSSKMKQTSIISFIKEVVEKNANKKKEKMTPIKANSLFEDVNNTSVYKSGHVEQRNHVTPKKNSQDNVPSNVPSNMSNEEIDTSNNFKENEGEITKESVKSSSKKKKDKNLTYFGFDDSEHDQENVSPVKKLDKRRLRALKPRARAVLQEINKQKGPTRALVPVAVKSKPIQNSEMANKLFDQMKSANEPPVFPDEDPIQMTEIANVTEAQDNADSNDDESVHLFEDIEVVHHLKGHRKSYGKAKRAVMFRQNSVSDSDIATSDIAEQHMSSDEDDLHDLTFKIPGTEPKKIRKKKPKKQKISKKEEQEVEAWAAGFNSMCEDVEEFDLVVE